MSSPGHSHSASSPPKPRPRMTLARSPSDPIPLSQPQTTTSPPQQIYVLSADGSSLFLLDPSKPSGNEEPPPYASHLARAIPFPQFADRVNGNDLQIPEGAAGHVRHRASTMSALADGSGEAAGPSRPRPRYHSSLSDNGSSYLHPQQQGLRSVLSSPGAPTYAYVDETMPLLAAPRAAQPEDGTEVVRKPRGAWRAVFCGELGEDDRRLGFVAGWKRFWSPVRDGTFWWPILHLCLINFPFALLVWPFLVVGTLVGTALLITLPLGAPVWWLTLFLARSAARLETMMQVRYHSPLNRETPSPTYHPIFHRVKERSPPSSPISATAEEPEIEWEKRFVKCSWAMFCDHYSYSALSYFLLIKPLIVLFSLSTIVVVVLFPVSLATIVGLPVYLRAARRWGKWQAGVALNV